jgi:hypothetical protein
MFSTWPTIWFVDSDAEFLFVPKSKVMEIAEKTGSIPFDTDGAELHHRDDRCTFDAIIKNYKLTDSALLRMAKVINAAGNGRLEDDPLAAGFERPSPWAKACASRMIWRTSKGNLRSTTPCMPGAGWMGPGVQRKGNRYGYF